MNKVPVTAYLSLGSNQGNRLENLQRACQALNTGRVCLVSTSSIYETEPVEFVDQGWFLNCVVKVKTTLEPLPFLRELQKIEQQLGRRREVPKGPRTIDIDVLLYGDRTIETKELAVPHPRMLERRFVLEPLREVAPSLRLPSGKTVEEACRDLRDPAQVRLLVKTLCA